VTTVTALLVSHDGSRWLPAVLDGLTGQTRPADRAVCVDTGSSDDGPRLVAERLPGATLLSAPADTSYGAAVARGLDALAPVAGAGNDEWVWLLHDDSAPAPDALERLLSVAASTPTVDILGPKLREWPSLRRLLEVGVTISGTGRRETGLERGEYDQGQHDRPRDVLAVNTAGMLVRRTVLERLGLDERLPLFGNDLDLGWRAARAGHRTVAVPDAVVFHVAAASRGVRPHPVAPRRHRAQRAAALYTLLANGSPAALPFTAVRLFLGSLLRALGLLLVRAPREAAGELAALLTTYGRPGRVVAARRSRRRTATVPARAVRPLLAPPWTPYRHGLDVLTDLGTGLVSSAGDLSAARRARSAGAAETGPVPHEAELPEDTGLVARLLSSPVGGVAAVLVVAALVAARGLVGGGSLSGGALLPAPGSALDWWRLYLSSSADVGTGSTAPAAPYVLPLAVLGTVLLGKAWLVVDLAFLLAVPLAALGAHRFLRRVTSSLPVSLWGAVAYGMLPVVGGAVPEGRLGTVAGALVLPWLAHAALYLGPAHDRDRRRRAVWRTALWLALLVAFVPAAWVLALLVAVAAVASGLRRGPGAPAGLAAATGVTLLAALVLLLPWSVLTWGHHGPSSWLFEAGLPSPGLTEAPTRWDVVLGRPGGAAPAWLSVGTVLAAVVALARPDTRPGVLRAWTVLVAALALTAVLTRADQQVWVGFPLLVAQAAGITAAAVAGTGVRRRLTGASFGWRQPVGVAAVLLALLTPVASLLWWVVAGSGDPVDRSRATAVPTYMSDAADADPLAGVLVVRGSRAGGFDYVLVRGPGVRLGEDTVLPSDREQSGLTRTVGDLASAPDPSDVARLTRLGVAFVYAPAPADPTLVGNLDSVSGLTQASATGPGSRAWQVRAAPTGSDLPRAQDPLRPWLLALQGLALLAVAVLAAPTRRTRR
jgi:GT2 family glycosyltransferase